eukprot:378497-Amorphochlora_amoeboformis.AAC.1
MDLTVVHVYLGDVGNTARTWCGSLSCGFLKKDGASPGGARLRKWHNFEPPTNMYPAHDVFATQRLCH